MKNASALKSKPETPKTPGGISKSLLTPCRRVGLSRNWRKSVVSPFQSPLPSTGPKQESVDSRKRKESLEVSPQKTHLDSEESSENVSTPSRKVELPHRKKSKMLLNSIVKTTDDDISQPDPLESPKTEENYVEIVPKDTADTVAAEVPKVSPVRLKSKRKSKTITDSADVAPVSTPVRLKSRSKIKKISDTKVQAEAVTSPSTKCNVDAKVFEKENVQSSNKLNNPIEIAAKVTGENTRTESLNLKKNNPNNLTKECIVVIQKKIFKKQLDEKEISEKTDKVKNLASQAMFDEDDTDDVQLKHLIKNKSKEQTIIIDDDEDFDTKQKLVQTNTKEKLKKPNKRNSRESLNNVVTVQIHDHPSQISIDDDDDDFVTKKHTILLRKSYDKVIKPHKAKSTGSITQKDIEDLKARIETKKKMLLAKSMSDTDELRCLIKKWQKGCQDALMELMDLMKSKCPDQSMEYSQILQSLKIPATLVGYDSDNDCFVTPEDNNIILSLI